MFFIAVMNYDLSATRTDASLDLGVKLDSKLHFYPNVDCIFSHSVRMLGLTLILLMWRLGWANSILIYIQQDATLHILFISGNFSTFFGWYFHPSWGAHTTVSTASGICHNTVTAICRYRGRVRTGLSVLWVAYAVQNIADCNYGNYECSTTCCHTAHAYKFYGKNIKTSQ
jgi:hypothetical protein